jgi:hypothetical protein
VIISAGNNFMTDFIAKFQVMDDDKERFKWACQRAAERRNNNEGYSGIGTLSEKTIHAALKNYFADENCQEVKVGSFVADAKTEDGIFEIQTRHFYTQKKKLEAFLPEYKVCLVYPVRHHRVLHWVDPETGEVTDGRKSPKIDRGYGIFHEMYGIREFINHENLTFCLMYIDSDEYKYLDGYGEDKKKHATRIDGVPTELVAEINLCAPEDYIIFIPEELRNEEFTSLSFSKGAKISRSLAQEALNVMRLLGIVTILRKTKEGNIYKVNTNI